MLIFQGVPNNQDSGSQLMIAEANGIQGTLSCAGGFSTGGASAASGGVCPPGEASCAKVSNEKNNSYWLVTRDP